MAAALGAANALASGKPIAERCLQLGALSPAENRTSGFRCRDEPCSRKNLVGVGTIRSPVSTSRQPLRRRPLIRPGVVTQGKKLQHAAFAAAGRSLPPSRFAADARSFARAVAKGKNVQHAALSIAAQRALPGEKGLPGGFERKTESDFRSDSGHARGLAYGCGPVPGYVMGRQIILSGV